MTLLNPSTTPTRSWRRRQRRLPIAGTGSGTIADFQRPPGGDVIDLQALLPIGVTAANATASWIRTPPMARPSCSSIQWSGKEPFAESPKCSREHGPEWAGGQRRIPASTTWWRRVVARAPASAGRGASSTILQGLGGNDTLNGSKDSDTLDGAPAATARGRAMATDTYIVDSTKDVIADIGGDDDRVQASISIDLNAAAYFAIDMSRSPGRPR